MVDDSATMRRMIIASLTPIGDVSFDQAVSGLEAIERLSDLLRLHPDHASACEALGGLLMNGGRQAEAERCSTSPRRPPTPAGTSPGSPTAPAGSCRWSAR